MCNHGCLFPSRWKVVSSRETPVRCFRIDWNLVLQVALALGADGADGAVSWCPGGLLVAQQRPVMFKCSSCLLQADGDGLQASSGGKGPVVPELCGPLPQSGPRAGGPLECRVPKGQKVRNCFKEKYRHCYSG